MKVNGKLHLLMSSAPRAVVDCLAFANEDESVLLVDRGVDILADSDAMSRFGNRAAGSLLALRADVQAAGLAQLALAFEVGTVSDAQWVELVCGSGHVLSWK